jgi:2-oxoisovalerate dehydrogenase E1 component
LKDLLLKNGFNESDLSDISVNTDKLVLDQYKKALIEKDPEPKELNQNIFAPTTVKEEIGNRAPNDKEPSVMVDSALFAIREILEKDLKCLLYGQDVGGRLGGVFREAATLAQQFGDHRVFNTPIQEAFIVGSTAGMSAVGLKPIVEVQFADYIWPGLNQLFTEISRSYYLSNGKWPISMILRVPIGAYGSGGPYHSSSIESIVTNIIGIKVIYPSNGADLKGLMKAAYLDPNPVLILEHKGLYWSKISGTEGAKTIEPDEDYILPIGKARKVIETDQSNINYGQTIVIITYGRGVYWSLEASKSFPGKIEILDLRSLFPLDEDQIFESVKKHGKSLIVTEEPSSASFSLGLAGIIQENCFEYLDAPIKIVGSENTPAIPLNENLELAYLPNASKVKDALSTLLKY